MCGLTHFFVGGFSSEGGRCERERPTRAAQWSALPCVDGGAAQFVTTLASTLPAGRRVFAESRFMRVVATARRSFSHHGQHPLSVRELPRFNRDDRAGALSFKKFANAVRAPLICCRAFTVGHSLSHAAPRATSWVHCRMVAADSCHSTPALMPRLC